MSEEDSFSSFEYLDALVEVFCRNEEDEQSKISFEEEDEEFQTRFLSTRIPDDKLERKEGICCEKNNGDKISGDIDDIVSRQHEMRLRWLSKRPLVEDDDEVVMSKKKREVCDVEEESSDDEEFYESLKTSRKNDGASTSRTTRRSSKSSEYDKEYFECLKITRKTNYGGNRSKSSRKDSKYKEECYEFVKKTRKNHGSKSSRRKSRKSGSRPTKKKGGSEFKTAFDPPPPLPANVRAAMEEGGPLDEEPVLVAHRVLTKTDLAQHQSRLQIPFNQMLHKNFLTEDELELLREETEQVQDNGKVRMARTHQVTDIIMPSMKRCKTKYTIWDMKTSSNFVFNGDWHNKVLDEKDAGKELECDMVLQIWAYRVQDNLRFAIVNLGHPGGSSDSYKDCDSSEEGEDHH